MHNLSHPGKKATLKLVTDRFVWPLMSKDVSKVVKVCLTCQKNKVNKHNKAPLGDFGPTDQRFEHIHVDIIGPLPPARGYRYCLTCVDRFSRWPTAIPLPDITAETIAFALINGWISSFGVPKRITSDLGRQFESQIFRELMRILVVRHLRTTAYHPQANGMVERWHRTLKAAIRCHETEDWCFVLPIVLLGLRATIKEDIKASPAEMVFGTPLRIPGEFFQKSTKHSDETEFVKLLRKKMQALGPAEASRHNTEKCFLQSELKDCKYVFIRSDHVRAPLEAPYTGPFEVIEKTDKYFTVQLDNRTTKVSIDRLKAAYVPNDWSPHRTNNRPPHMPPEFIAESSETGQSQPILINTEKNTNCTSHTSNSENNAEKTTRSGRRVRFPARYL